MRLKLLSIVAAGMAIWAGSVLSATAQVDISPITFSFAVPQGFDPLKVIFTSPGTQTVDASAFINTSGVPFVPGVEVHSRIPGPNGGFLDINSLEIQFDYPGQVSINPPPGPPTPGYLNWLVQSELVVNNHYDIVFINPAPIPFSAPINDNFDPGPAYPSHQSFAGLGVEGDANAIAAFVGDPNNPNKVTITAGHIGAERGGGTVPEPGALAMFGGLGVTLGGWLVHRRVRGRRARKSGD